MGVKCRMALTPALDFMDSVELQGFVTMAWTTKFPDVSVDPMTGIYKGKLDSYLYNQDWLQKLLIGL